MKNFALILFITIAYSVFPQSAKKGKYFIYFNDKGEKFSKSLNKNSVEYSEILANLSQRAIKRRMKNLGGENLISFEDYPVYQPYIDSLHKLNIKIVWELKWLNAVSCYLTQTQFDEIKELEFVKSVQAVKRFVTKKTEKSVENIELNKSAEVNANYGPSFDEMNLSDIPVAHNLGITGDGVLIGVLDGGFIWQNHPAIKNTKVIETYDFVYKDTNVSNDPDVSHGTAVLSLIAANDDGNMIGPAYNAEFILAKTEDVRTEKNVEEDNYAAALEWLESKGVDITTASLGYSEFDAGQDSYTYNDMDGKTAVCTKALEIAFQKGIVTINAAGNEGSNSWHYITAPADGFNVITVGAIDGSNQVTSFSSRGPTYDGRIKPEVVAFGKSNYVADASKNSYKSGDGTSYATPLVAGMTAQLLSLYPHLTNRQVRKIILESGDNSSLPNNDRGYGLLSVKKAISYPNFADNGSTLNKIFITVNSAFDGTVIIHHKKSGETEYKSAEMSHSSIIYNFDFTDYSVGDTIQFYFSYTYSGNTVIEPFEGNYFAIYGSIDISHATEMRFEPIPPTDYRLCQNFPNPFNPTTKIRFDIPAADKYARVNLKIYDVLGREVAELMNEVKHSGTYELNFDAEKYRLTSGTYFLRMKVNDFSSVIKLIYLK